MNQLVYNPSPAMSRQLVQTPSSARTLSNFAVLWLLAVGPIVPRAAAQDASNGNEFVGSDQCAICHPAIAEVQFSSDHSRTLRRIEKLADLLKAVPLGFSDQPNGVEYRLEKSASPGFTLDLVATKGRQVERLHLLWGIGAGRKGITFIGRTEAGEYGQSLLSWYRKINQLDTTPGLEKEVTNAHEALADWLTPPRREHCFGCHITRQAEALPETIEDQNAGVRCERCHGPGKRHIEAVARGKGEARRAIGNPGRLTAIEQIYFCGACHGTPPGATAVRTISRNMADVQKVRFPAQRLVLSDCYNESLGRLKCTTCHNPHENLPPSAQYFDSKCQSCHDGQNNGTRRCSKESRDCTRCHMPLETGFMPHSEFADHWIRIPANR